MPDVIIGVGTVLVALLDHIENELAAVDAPGRADFEEVRFDEIFNRRTIGTVW